jgi:c-di-AMP phosphodiesterase-like protein
VRKLKFNEVFVPKYRTYLTIIFLILFAICIKVPEITPVAVVLYIGVLYLTYRRNLSQKEKVIKYIDSLIFKLNTDDSILDFPVPAVIITNQGDILWNNSKLDNIFRGINKERFLENLLKEVVESMDENNKTIDKEISIHDKYYRLLGNLVNLKIRERKDPVIMLYFIDRTDYYRLYKVYEDEKDCVGMIVVDNYEDLMQSMIDTDRPQMMAVVEKILREWFSFTGGIFTRLDRDRFFILFERKHLKTFLDNKFEILDSIKEVNFNNKIPITLSIGINAENDTQYQKFQNAISTIDIALGRGGDQAVVKKDGKYEFFGGKSKELEKRTRVKSRIVAQALEQLINESKNVVIMGHRVMDVDSLGSSLGIYRLAKTLKKDANIVFNNYGITLEEILKKMAKDKIYNDVLLETDDISSKMSPETLLVVVDTHKRDYVEAPELLEKTSKIVVIDHHRRSTDFINEAILTFHEVYASSTSELVTEILEYSDENLEITQTEAECLYAGIITDTKNFSYKTGVRTFEAAAYLKKTGVDITEVKKLFENDLDTYVSISDIIRNAEIVYENVAIAICPKGLENTLQIAAQAADELLTISEIETSFVLTELEGYVNISGRSNGKVNVQTILEKLGGGGHMTMAGAQVQNVTIDKAKEMLVKALEEEKNIKE